VHLSNVFLLYYLFKRLSYLIFGTENGDSEKKAFIAAILFGISPFNLEPVAWVAASKVLLYALFYLAALHCYLRYISRSKNLYFYLTIIFFILSFGAKEQAVTLPFCLILLDYLNNRKLSDIIVWQEKLPFLVLAILFGFVTIESQGSEVIESTHFYPVDQRLLLAFYTISEYFTKALIPINLSYLYPFPFQIGKPAPMWLWFYPVGISAILYCFHSVLKVKFIFFGLIFFAIHIILVINILSLARFSIVADRYAYLANGGLYFILGCGFFLLFKKSKKFSVGLLVIYMTYFMVYTYTHSVTWTNSESLKKKIGTAIKSRKDYKIWRDQSK